MRIASVPVWVAMNASLKRDSTPTLAAFPGRSLAIRPIHSDRSLRHAGRGCHTQGGAEMTTLLSLSNELAEAVERVAGAVVTVNARPRLASTGVHWRQGIIVTADHTV